MYSLTFQYGHQQADPLLYSYDHQAPPEYPRTHSHTHHHCSPCLSLPSVASQQPVGQTCSSESEHIILHSRLPWVELKMVWCLPLSLATHTGTVPCLPGVTFGHFYQNIILAYIRAGDRGEGHCKEYELNH